MPKVEASMEYFITRIVIGEPRSIAISAEEYRHFGEAYARLTTVLGLEQKFELVLWSFEEYEEELLRLALHRMVWTGTGFGLMRDGWHTVNRRVLNLLAAARMYLDQACVDVSATYGKTSSVYVSLKAVIAKQYDDELAYRAMEGLRNHAQHRSMPVGSVKYPMRIERERPDVMFRFSVLPLLEVSELRQHGAVKTSVLDELSQLSETPSLSPLIRQYVECLGNIHDELRRLTALDIENCDRLIEGLRERAREVFGDELIGLGIVARNQEGFAVEQQYLWPETIAERKRLHSKSKVLNNLGRRYVTSAEEEENT